MQPSIVREIIDSSKPMLLVHGGAWDIPEDEHASHHDGMLQALTLGSKLIRSNQDALTIVSDVVSLLEDHEAFDAGYGSVLNRQGEVEMDAGIMDGESGNYGSVMGVKTIKNPIQVALKLSSFEKGQSRMLTAKGAEEFAKRNSLETVDPSYFVHPRETSRFKSLQKSDSYHTSQSFAGSNPRGTVGCVVLDKQGKIAAGTSTGGAPFTLSGRIGDSPLPGAGFYANDECGVSCTGWGEAIAGVVLAARLADLTASKLLDGNGAHLLEKMKERYSSEKENATAGYILLRSDHAEFAFNTPKMARAYWSEGLGFETRLARR